jgi:hypothetical protein
MESKKQLRTQQEEIRLTRLANASLSRDNESIRSRLDDLQESLDRAMGERLELKAQVHCAKKPVAFVPLLITLYAA